VAQVLILQGGWPGHRPEEFGDFAVNHLFQEDHVVQSSDLRILESHTLADFDLVVPIWTYGELTQDQEQALVNAVSNGLGFVAWHGAASAFLLNRLHKFMLGGQFVAHPGGNLTTFTVQFLDNDPLVDGLCDITLTSEQYYLLVDPAVKVLAVTEFKGSDMAWIEGVRMPVAWKRQWGKGRVFYCSLGHTVEILKEPSITALMKRAVQWAARSPQTCAR